MNKLTDWPNTKWTRQGEGDFQLELGEWWLTCPTFEKNSSKSLGLIFLASCIQNAVLASLSSGVISSAGFSSLLHKRAKHDRVKQGSQVRFRQHFSHSFYCFPLFQYIKVNTFPDVAPQGFCCHHFLLAHLFFFVYLGLDCDLHFFACHFTFPRKTNKQMTFLIIGVFILSNHKTYCYPRNRHYNTTCS